MLLFSDIEGSSHLMQRLGREHCQQAQGFMRSATAIRPTDLLCDCRKI
jgi:hypothetical protein